MMLEEFIKTCNIIGSDPSLVQGPGGNISFKDNNNMMYIKSSGFCLHNIKENFGYNIVDFKKFREFFSSQQGLDNIHLEKEQTYNQLLSTFSIDNIRPSMETGFHSSLGSIIIHTHPVYLNAILCSINGEKIITSIFNKLNFSYIPYLSPGYNLSYHLSKNKKSYKIYFLSNHGLIVNSNTFDEGINITNEINSICEEYLSKSSKFIKYEDFEIKDYSDNTFNAFYPDSAVYISKKPDLKNPHIKEIIKSHRYIEFIINNNKELMGVKYFPKNEIEYVRKLETEKYRMKLIISEKS